MTGTCLKKITRGYSWTLAGALPKKSTLNVNRKITPETPQMHPCYSSNIPTIFPPQSPAVPTSWNAFHPYVYMACSFTLSDLYSKVTLTILYKTAKPQHKHTSTSIPLPCFILFHSTYHALTYKTFVYCFIFHHKVRSMVA